MVRRDLLPAVAAARNAGVRQVSVLAAGAEKNKACRETSAIADVKAVLGRDPIDLADSPIGNAWPGLTTWPPRPGLSRALRLCPTRR